MIFAFLWASEQPALKINRTKLFSCTQLRLPFIITLIEEYIFAILTKLRTLPSTPFHGTHVMVKTSDTNQAAGLTRSSFQKKKKTSKKNASTVSRIYNLRTSQVGRADSSIFLFCTNNYNQNIPCLVHWDDSPYQMYTILHIYMYIYNLFNF